MASVNNILGTDKIDSILFFENIVQNPKNPIHGKNSRIIMQSLSFCQSIHDIPVSHDSSHINNFIEKYKITHAEKNIFIKNVSLN